MRNETTAKLAEVWEALERVKDPEIPPLNVVDMGIITQVEISADRVLHVSFVPTFVGCPALEVIRKNIEEELGKLDFSGVEVRLDKETIWTSDRLTAEAKRKLEVFGLAPPTEINGELSEEALNKVRCPLCGSTDTSLRSPFGSTLCRAIRFCFHCKQGFEQFKPV